jgi:hypothetical protein
LYFLGQDGTVDDEVVTTRKEVLHTLSFNDILWKVVTPPANITSSVAVTNNQYPCI